MLLDDLSDLFQRGLEYAWDCEQVLSKQFPKMSEAATSGELKSLLEAQVSDTKRQIERLEQIFQRLERSPAAEKSEPIRVVVEECERMMRHLDRSALLDAALIFCGNQMAHYQIGLYGSLRGFAHVLGQEEAAGLIDATRREEVEVDLELTRLAEGSINRAASDVHNAPPFALI